MTITKNTRIHSLLASYPHLEQVIIDMNPKYRKLRNPLLRNTIARVATVRIAARIGGIPVETFLDKLRTSTGGQ